MTSRILDPSFKYVPSNRTDLRKTFARINRLMREEQEAKALAEAQKVMLIKRRKP